MEYGSVTYDILQFSALSSTGFTIALLGKFFAPFNLPATVLMLALIFLVSFSAFKFYWLAKASKDRKAHIIIVNSVALVISLITLVIG